MRQRGMVLVFSLIVLVIMSVAGLMMLRSVKSGLGIAGNIGFKQNATSSADLGIERARAWLMNNVNDKNIDSGAGYYATWNGGVTQVCVALDGSNRPCEFNPLNYDWGTLGDAANTRAVEATLGEPDQMFAGNRIRYVIHRLCSTVGATTATGQNCVLVPGDLERGEGGGGAEPGIDSVIKQPYFRVTARVDGPRNTVSYVQVVMF